MEDGRGNAPQSLVCISCGQGSKPDTLYKAWWHEQCNGWTGGYIGVPRRRCLCTCKTSTAHRTK